MYLSMLAKVRRPSITLLQHHQALLQQNDIRRLAGDIHRAVDRDADIRRAQRRASLMPSPIKPTT